MLLRFVALSLFLSALFAGLVSLAGHTADRAAALAPAESAVGSAAPEAPATSIPARNGGEVELARAPDSHFYADVAVNGRTVRMMVDSGASIIALTRADAETLGIDVDALPQRGTARTAGGPVPLRPLSLERVAVDGLEVADVAAAVLDADMPASLLGQSFLQRLDGVTVEGDRMILR